MWVGDRVTRTAEEGFGGLNYVRALRMCTYVALSSAGALAMRFAAIRSEWNFAGELRVEGPAALAPLLVGVDGLRSLKCAALAVCCVPSMPVSLLCVRACLPASSSICAPELCDLLARMCDDGRETAEK